MTTLISDPTAMTEEEVMVRDTIRAFAREEVEPGELNRDRTKEFPHDLVRWLAEQGMLGIPVPEEYGGAGMSTLSYAIVVEEVAKVSGSLALTLAAHTSLGTMPIVDFGTEEQKQKFLPDLASGTKLGAFALTEPMAGSDAGATKTTAVVDGDHYVLNGQKSWITNAGLCGLFRRDGPYVRGQGGAGESRRSSCHERRRGSTSANRSANLACTPRTRAPFTLMIAGFRSANVWGRKARASSTS